MTVPHVEQSVSRIGVAVVTVSDTRTAETDESGRLLAELCAAAGHVVASREIVPDETARIAECVRRLAGRPDVQAIILTGGTGISARDTTIEAVEALLEKELPGFGELFRRLSYEQVGPRAMLSRATAGVYQGVGVFALPGAPGAVRLAADKLILPAVGHMVWLLSR